MLSPTEIINTLRAELPPTIARSSVPRLTGGIVSSGTLANADSKGTGPAGLYYLGRKAFYTREAFLAWLEAKLTRAKVKPVGRAA